VDDPSQLAREFPTEEAQNQERQRLFDILGRIDLEKDKKATLSRWLEGWYLGMEIDQPNSAVLLEAHEKLLAV
jgi:putative DNA methylase